MRRRSPTGLLVAAVCLTCACLAGVLMRQSGQGGNGKHQVELQGGKKQDESLAALERKRERLQTFIAREGGARDASHTEVRVEPRQPDEGRMPVKQRRWPDADSRQWHEALQQKAGRGKRCGKLCQTRKMILAARGRIDEQAHVELQQLAVST